VTVCATLITGYWGLSLECSWRHCCVVCYQFPRHSLYLGWRGGVCNPGHRLLGAQFGMLLEALLCCLLSVSSPLFVPRVVWRCVQPWSQAIGGSVWKARRGTAVFAFTVLTTLCTQGGVLAPSSHFSLCCCVYSGRCGGV